MEEQGPSKPQVWVQFPVSVREYSVLESTHVWEACRLGSIPSIPTVLVAQW